MGKGEKRRGGIRVEREHRGCGLRVVVDEDCAEARRGSEKRVRKGRREGGKEGRGKRPGSLRGLWVEGRV